MTRKQHDYPKERNAVEGNCTNDGCDRPMFTKGVCRRCYDASRGRYEYDCEACGRKNTSGYLCGTCHYKLSPGKPCSVEDCDAKAVSYGHCFKHAYRRKTHGTTDEPPRRVGPPPQNPMSRFFKYVQVDHESGCWNWTGSKTSQGYGRFAMKARPDHNGYAHRASHVLFKGEIPEGLTIDHLCRNRGCVNPEHLEAVTLRENILRSPNQVASINIRKTECPKGHPYDEENTAYDKNGNRACKTCRRAYYWTVTKPRKEAACSVS